VVGRGLVLVGGGSGGEEEAGGAGELGLAVDQKGSLGGDLVAGGEAGADDVEVVAVFVFEAGAEGERGEGETGVALGVAGGDFPGDVANAGGEYRGFGNENELAPRGAIGGVGGLEVFAKSDLKTGVDQTAGGEKGAGSGEVDADLAGAVGGVDLGGDTSDGGFDLRERAGVVAFD
jgi:hypothetical protein